MTLSSSIASIAVMAWIAMLAGCSVDAGVAPDGDGVASESELASSIEPGSFKLYGDAHHVPTPGCDVFTSLELLNQGGARAQLREAVGGVCELFVEPNEREFRLRLTDTPCGSKVYTGTKRIGGQLQRVTVTDHRTRVCRDLVEARVIVETQAGTDSAKTLYSYDPPPPTPTWLTYMPTQCDTNPWNNVKAPPGLEPSFLQGEAGQVDEFFRSKGIVVDQIGFAVATEPMFTCASCSCPRGDKLIVHAKSPADAAKLVSQFGFGPMLGGLTRSPTQCGTNPWEKANDVGLPEAQELANWSESVGAPLTSIAFVDYTQPHFVCLACQCPRGDVAVVFPKDALGASKLQDNFGWSQPAN
jgi:hypothetical protein